MVIWLLLILVAVQHAQIAKKFDTKDVDAEENIQTWYQSELQESKSVTNRLEEIISKV